MRATLSPEEENCKLQGTGSSEQLQLLNPHALSTRAVDPSTVKHSGQETHDPKKGNYKNPMARAVELS